MRTSFVESLCELAAEDDRIWLLCGDLGFSVLEPFAERFPNRFVNAGVAEQNMTGVAAGLAHCGKIVITYSIANFPLMRCLEQIRNDVCYHNLNVKIVSVGGGLSYGSAGYSHHGVEDFAVTTCLPNMKVIAPGDPIETRLATKAILTDNGPCYLRLGKSGESQVHTGFPDFTIGRAICVREGHDVTLVSTGGMLCTIVDAANQLASHGISARVLSMHTVSPIDDLAIRDAASATGGIVSVEEHGIFGLGTAIADFLARNELNVRFRSLNIGHEPATTAGNQAELRANAGLSTNDVIETAIKMVKHPTLAKSPIAWRRVS